MPIAPRFGPFTRWRRDVCRRFAVLPGGHWLFPTRRRLVTLRHCCTHEEAQGLVIMLPGIIDMPGDFVRHGFVDAARAAGVRADIVEVDSHVGYYLRRSVVRRLHEDLIQPAREAGYASVWLVGVSLGGLGALLYAQEHAEAIDGVGLLAPFVGFEKFIDAMIAAGGPRSWRARAGEDFQHDLWHWLVNQEEKPPIWLGFGEQDCFAPANRLLGELLPQQNVLVTTGGHEWATWQRLWSMMLAQEFLATGHRPLRRRSDA